MSVSPPLVAIRNGIPIAYHYFKGEAPNYGVLFAGGFRSSMMGNKALALESYCIDRGCSFCRFDYRGHGESGSDFLDCTLSDWIEDTLFVIDTVFGSLRPVILVGSSMGAWIALHVAMNRPEQIVGIVGIAAAPDFTDDLSSKLTPGQQSELRQNRVVYLSSEYDEQPYPITEKFLVDAKQYRLLSRSIPISCPVRLLHGQLDSSILWQTSIRLAEALDSCDVHVTLIKNGDHRLSKPSDLAVIKASLASMLTPK